MAIAGSLTYDTKIDKNGFEKGLNSLKGSVNTVGGQIKSIVAGLGIDKLISSAFNTIQNSVDGAISRLDTLNNFPKVMKNLGVSSDKSQKSIDKMSKKLSGLPTTLNDGALAVQRFTSANGDIEKSTDYFLALNNAILAGGASTDIQSTALEQLSQSYAKGKPDMMEWRSLMTAMPAQLNQVAQAMGYVSTDALGEALREGNISMDEFMDKIVELNENGTNGFQSFEEQAKNSTGGIATSITVAKTQIVKGVADIIKSFDQILKDNGFGGLGEIISNVGKGTKKALDLIAEKLPDVINGMKKLEPIIVAIVTALTAYKLALLAITAINFVASIWGTISAFIQLLPAIKSVKDAMLLLNMAFGVNPIALIIAAIAGLVAIFVVLWKKCDWFRNFWIGLWNKIKEAIQPVIDFMVEAFSMAWETIQTIWDFVSPYFEMLWENIKTIFSVVKEVLGGYFSMAWENIKLIWNNVIGYFQLIWTGIKTIFSVVKAILSGNFGDAWEAIKKYWNEVGGYFQRVWDNIKAVFNNVGSFFKNAFQTAWNGVKGVFSNVGSFFGGIWDTIKSKFTTVGTMVAEAIGGAFKSAANAVIGTVERAINKIPKAINKAIDKINDLPGVSISSIPTVTLPRLERGIGIAEKGKQYLLEGTGNESVVPLDKNKYWVKAVTEELKKQMDIDSLVKEMNRTVSVEKGSVVTNASIKSSNMSTTIYANISLEGSVEMNDEKVGTMVAPIVMKTIQTGGAYA